MNDSPKLPVSIELALAIINRTASVEQLRTALRDLGYTVLEDKRYEVWEPEQESHWRDHPRTRPNG